jgi:formylglycine-generating enzyme required for sulfatase activity
MIGRDDRGDAAHWGATVCDADRVCFGAGLSQLGQNGSEARFEERPARLARLASFAIDRREVSMLAYAQCVAAQRCSPVVSCDTSSESHDSGVSHADGPVTCVSWDQARVYCESQGGRLPSEAEWERAAAGRFPEHRRFPWGESDAGFADLTPEGVELLGGGVAEWVNDVGAFYLLPRGSSTSHDAGTDASDSAAAADGWINARTTASVASENTENEHADAAVESIDAGALVIVDHPRGPREGPWRVARGGHAHAPTDRWTSTARTFRLANDRRPWIGFRCAYSGTALRNGGTSDGGPGLSQ